MASLRRFSPLVAAVAVCALAAPALADNVGVTLTGAGGTRQFSVEDMLGAPLTTLDLGTGSAQPFKVHVRDAAFLPSAGQGGYTVSATMSNLYLKTGPSSYNYAVKVPSSELSIGFGANPLSIGGLSLADLPKISISGTLAGCSNPITGLLAFATSLGLTLATLTADAVTALTSLCTKIGAAAAPITTVVDGALQNLTGLVPTSLLDAPTALAGASGGTFTNPSYGAGTVGESDTTKPAGAPAATPVTLMTGTPNMSAGLAALITSALSTATAGVPLLASSGSALTSVAAISAKLADAGIGTAAAALQQLLTTLSSTAQLSLLNDVFDATGFAVPALSDISAVTGSYYSVPVLTANPRTPVAGTYGGTMTVTFVQS